MPWTTRGDHLSWCTTVETTSGLIRIVGLDTLVPGTHGGAFDAERADWLRQTLATEPDTSTLIAMHHPPFASGIEWMDEMSLVGADRFAQVIADAGNVERIFCGHLHRPMTTTIGGVTTTVGLSTVHHIELNFEPNAPVQVIRDPVGYQLHRFDGTNWVTHNRHIDTGEQPFVPS